MSAEKITHSDGAETARLIPDEAALELLCIQLKGAEAMLARLDREVGGDYAVRFPAMANTLVQSIAALRLAIAEYVALHPEAVSLLLNHDFAVPPDPQ